MAAPGSGGPREWRPLGVARLATPGSGGSWEWRPLGMAAPGNGGLWEWLPGTATAAPIQGGLEVDIPSPARELELFPPQSHAPSFCFMLEKVSKSYSYPTAIWS